MIEIHAGATPFDGGVYLASCDKGMPGNLMGMARVNVPAVMVTVQFVAPRGPLVPTKIFVELPKEAKEEVQLLTDPTKPLAPVVLPCAVEEVTFRFTALLWVIVMEMVSPLMTFAVALPDARTRAGIRRIRGL